MDTRKYQDANTLCHTPLLPHLPFIPCINPPSKCMERVRSHLFYVCLTFPALPMYTTMCNSLNTLHHTPSYPTCHLFPALAASKFMKQVYPIICDGWAGTYGGDTCPCWCGDEVEVKTSGHYRPCTCSS
jgi:hypothetical protein